MNANELADALQETEPYYSTDYKLFDKAAAMLRQQQAEIEALKKQLAFMEGEYPEPTIMAKMMEVDLVRQQQAEIEALKNILAEVDRQVFNIELKDDGTMTPVIRMEKK